MNEAAFEVNRYFKTTGIVNSVSEHSVDSRTFRAYTLDYD